MHQSMQQSMQQSLMPQSPLHSQSPPQIPVSEDVYLELPPEPILQALGTNYNAMVRTWTLRQYQLHLEHHQKMCHYYQQCISRLQDLEVRYEREPEQTPVAAVTSGPIKLSELAKMRPQQTIQQKTPTTTTTTTTSSGPSAAIQNFNGKTSGNTLSSSLAAKEVKLDKKPKAINVSVEMDDEERESLQEPEMQHFSRPQPNRKNNKRSDLPRLQDDKSEDEVSTWQENPNAFKDGNGEKESKIKSTFGNLKSSLFSKTKEESNNNNNNNNNNTTNSPPSTIPSSPPSQPPTWNQPPSQPPSGAYNSYGNTPTYNNNNGYSGNSTASGPPPIKTGASAPPPLTIPPAPESGPPRLNIPPPPPTPTFGPR